MARKPLWSCPACGAKLVTPRLAHACGAHSVEAFLAGKGPRARALYARFVELLSRCGPFEPAPAKTRVAFMVRLRFASINGLSERGMRFHVVVMRPLRHARIRRVERIGSCYVHHASVRAPEELDDTVEAWLKEAYAYGEERHRAAR